MTNKEEELNPHLKQITQLTIEQLVNGIHIWINNTAEDEPGFVVQKGNQKSKE